jgi:hypothetical protein
MTESWRGFAVDELAGAEVGQVHSLFVDAESGRPAWLIAVLGRRGARVVAVPLSDCAGGGGRVWIAHEREALRDAPVVDPRRPLLREHELAICAHYGIGELVGRAAEVAGRPEGAITSRPT